MSTIGTYLPTWATQRGVRKVGIDEDAVTLVVAAGLMALGGLDELPTRVVVVTRQPPLLEGGNGAAILGGLGLPFTTEVVEQLGGAPAALDAITTAPLGTLVLGADVDGSPGAGAWFATSSSAPLLAVGRSTRSLPLHARSIDGVMHEDDDPRLQRERGLRASLIAADLQSKPLAIAGASRRDASSFCAGDPPALPTSGASSPFFALAALSERSESGLVVAVEQALLSAAEFDPASLSVRRHEPATLVFPIRETSDPDVDVPDIKMVFTAYERAFEAKLRWEAGRCTSCATLALPPRHRCLTCGNEDLSDLVALPRTGSVYTMTTIHVPVPGLLSPYTLAVVDLDEVGVRALVTVTDAVPGSIAVGDRGSLVFRRLAIRSGIPDYGYAFRPEPRQ